VHVKLSSNKSLQRTALKRLKKILEKNNLRKGNGVNLSIILKLQKHLVIVTYFYKYLKLQKHLVIVKYFYKYLKLQKHLFIVKWQVVEASLE
jgi:hypothetical protein